MRQGIQTGQHIYATIKFLEKEVETVKEAMGNVASSMGEDTTAYALLAERQKGTQDKLNSLLETKFTVIGK